MDNIAWYSDGNPTSLQQNLFEASATQKYRLGTKIWLNDGRAFRYVLNGAVAGVPGSLVQSVVMGTANHFEEVNTGYTASIGDTEIYLLPGATAFTANQYAEGFLWFNKVDSVGQMYKVKSHPAADASTVCLFKLYDALREDVLATAEWSLSKHPCAGVIEAPITTSTGCLVGVYTWALTASYYGWVQCEGPCAVLTSGTVVVGDKVVHLVAAAGACGPAADDIQPTVGRVMSVNATGEWSLVWLTLG